MVHLPTGSVNAAAYDKPTVLPVVARNIPEALCRMPCWVVWKYVPEKDAETGEVDWDKPPVNARTHRLAKSTDPATWSRFDHALDTLQRGGYDGLGICLHATPEEDEVLVGIDLDDVRDPATGEIEPWTWSGNSTVTRR
jgi:primase-polymerase (primpol)-like protein